VGALRKSVVRTDKRRRDKDPLAFSLEGQRSKIIAAPGADHDLVD
jgi:hypothetical protein